MAEQRETGPIMEQEAQLIKIMEQTDFHRLIYINREAILAFLATQAGKAYTEYLNKHREGLAESLASNWIINGQDCSDQLRGRLYEVKDILAMPKLIENIQTRKLRYEKAMRNIQAGTTE